MKAAVLIQTQGGDDVFKFAGSGLKVSIEKKTENGAPYLIIHLKPKTPVELKVPEGGMDEAKGDDNG